ncbi:hypothetical protein [Salidesulfovibrio brasiliensis]|uniref:hypothetical protein n=1 Tax=Salidesulfovibrio brasiliensis TaxID=221711 RepID=UPI0006D14152|nr:hypothetical protein [Salidesulfovibrio brasiliensis]
MGTVVALDRFRESVERGREAQPPKPSIRGTEIWGRDYTRIESVVFGLLKARDIVGHHMGRHDEDVAMMLLNALEKAYKLGECGHEELVAAMRPLKDFIVDCMDEGNRRDLSMAIVILDLIEKSPVHRK